MIYISVTFGRTPKQYTYKTTLDISVGDRVVIPVTNSHTYAVAKVVEVDTEPSSEWEYKHVVQVIDSTHYNKALAEG